MNAHIASTKPQYSFRFAKLRIDGLKRLITMWQMWNWEEVMNVKVKFPILNFITTFTQGYNFIFTIL